MLHVHVASRDADGRQRRDGDQHRVDVRAPAPRVMQRGDQEHDAQRDDADALEDAQRTGIQAQLVLRIEGVGEQRRRRRESRRN